MEMSEPIEEDEDEAALKAAMSMSLGGNPVSGDVSGKCCAVLCCIIMHY